MRSRDTRSRTLCTSAATAESRKNIATSELYNGCTSIRACSRSGSIQRCSTTTTNDNGICSRHQRLVIQFNETTRTAAAASCRILCESTATTSTSAANGENPTLGHTFQGERASLVHIRKDQHHVATYLLTDGTRRENRRSLNSITKNHNTATTRARTRGKGTRSEGTTTVTAAARARTGHTVRRAFASAMRAVTAHAAAAHARAARAIATTAATCSIVRGFTGNVVSHARAARAISITRAACAAATATRVVNRARRTSITIATRR